MSRSRKDDFIFANHGSITVLTPVTRRAKSWAAEYLIDNGEVPRWGLGIVVEPRYVGPVIDGIFGDGLTVAGV